MEWKKLHCYRCDYEWYPKNPEKLPKICPACKSRYYSQVEQPKSGPKRRVKCRGLKT